MKAFKNKTKEDTSIVMLVFFILLSFTSYSQTEANKIKIIKGIYKGHNLFIRNPFGSGGVGFCMKSVKINGKDFNQCKGSVVELDFSSVNVKINDSVTIAMEHDPYCGPGVLNLDDIQANAGNFYSKSVLIHGKILDEITKKPVSGVNVLTMNKRDSSIVSYIAPGIDLGTYNIIVNWGEAYEITFESDSTDFDYSIKKIVLDLRGIPQDGSFNFKTKIDVEFLLSKKSNRLMDSLFSKFPVAKLAFNSYSKELKWDTEYSDAIKEASSSLLKQVEKENEVKEKQLIIGEEQKQKKYLLAIIVFIALVTILAIYAFFRQKKLKELVNLKKIEAEEQRQLVEEKQKEILDSIHYARRIQNALITSEKYIERNLNKLNKE